MSCAAVPVTWGFSSSVRLKAACEAAARMARTCSVVSSSISHPTPSAPDPLVGPPATTERAASMNLQQSAETGGAMAAKAAPPLAVLSAQLAGVPIADWVQWLTFCYVLLMIAHKVWQIGWGMWKFWVLKDRKGE